MTLNEFETALYHNLYDFFYDAGFEMLAGKKQFRKNVENGFQNVIFSPSVYENECWLELNLGSRHKEVESIVQQFLDNYREYQQDTNTVIISIGKLTNNKYFKYKAIDKDDLLLVCDQIKIYMKQGGFSFMEQCSSVAHLDKLFNKMPSKPCRYLYNQSHRCFKGLVIAKLSNNNKYQVIKNIYRSALKTYGAKQGYIQNFDKLAGFLEHYSVN